MSSEQYIGGELELFRDATNWKAYFSGKVKPYIGSRVLEVGAGIGETTRALCDGTQAEWLCLEPDPQLAAMIEAKIANGELPACCRVATGKLADVSKGEFDTVIYIDVLEHIEDDHGEVKKAVGHLQPGGRLVILAPAHQWLFSEFDKSIGHFRRYDKSSLLAAVGNQLRLENSLYLDSIGTLLSMANRMLLKQSLPTKRQIAFWDRFIVPLSRTVDPLTGFRLGKSLLTVFRK